MTFFVDFTEYPPDAIFGLVTAFNADPRPDKYSFVLGYYCDEQLETPILHTVAEVEEKLAAEKRSRKYLSIDGDQEFVSALGELTFGERFASEKICGIQTVGGTGALYLAGILAKNWTSFVAVSDPTWANHRGIFSLAGHEVSQYPYYHRGEIPFEKLLTFLSSLPEKACVLFHASCHNPSGIDFTREQWHILSELCFEKKLFPIFDLAYQGFSGEPDEDAYGIRYFVDQGHELMVTYTCAKNFSIYSERVGALFVVTQSEREIEPILSQLRRVIRGSYSNPPIHGETIVKTILRDASLREKWLEELKEMRGRIKQARSELADALAEKIPDEDWEFLRKGAGLFFYSELKTPGVMFMRKERGLYLASNGRVNVTALNQHNLPLFVEAFVSARELG